ncbi:transporter [Rudanella paleaurantiibacter]|uniref:Transporter n=1 Tax=Rudanella paleaurantiibacter TaxID=2614655 RepID=A0A7J5U3Q5_9BACT|nr:TolB family protein [Rudanella paleaurantiibacter]KAB7732479.1 transporter [Rudanella paleaurantiibacter]
MNRTLALSLCITALALTQSVRAQRLTSQLETYDLATGQRSVIHRDTVRFEAPNWTNDGRFLIINQGGKLYRVTLKTGRKEVINTDFATACNNDHGLTPDGKTIIISHNDKRVTSGANSRVFTLPVAGGVPRLITEQAPSYWHGVSPDGKTLAYVGERTGTDGKRDYDIYTMPITGGTTETRLTTEPGLDDGPDYSPDGRYIYFNSIRSGRMQIWRMNADGSAPTQLTNDAYANWFPHPSPNGRYIVFISYVEDQGSAHPADKDVMLRLMDLQSGALRELARFRGGQGTINVPSWSPDSKKFAFVSY